MAVSLAQEVVNNAFIDLNPIASESGGASSSGNSKPSAEAMLQTPQPSHRKRKHGASSGSLEWHNTSSLEGRTPSNHTSRIAVKIPVLEALEALLAVLCALLQCIFGHRIMFTLIFYQVPVIYEYKYGTVKCLLHSYGFCPSVA
ncbi:unnamed protein product [Prunus armeniaca]